MPHIDILIDKTCTDMIQLLTKDVILMDKTTLVEFFQTLNESESFYKTVFDSRGQNYINQNHFDQFDFLDIVNNNPKLLECAPENAFVFPDEITESHHFFTENKDSTITVFRHNRYTPVFYHKHTFFELVIILKGSCKHIINDSDTVINSGTMCLIPPYVYHGLWASDDSIVINININKKFFTDIWSTFSFQNNILSNFFNTSMFSKIAPDFLIFNTNNDKDIKDLILDMYIEHNCECNYKKQVIESMAIILFSRLLRHYEYSIVQNSPQKNTIDNCALFIEYIEQHIANIELEEMAKHFNYSSQYLSKKIRRNTGLTFTEIVKQIRFDKAKKMLRNSVSPISEIAFSLGYQNPENFTRTFKQISGQTPAEYRKSRSRI